MFEPVAIDRLNCSGESLLLLADAAAPIGELSGKVQAVYVDPPFMTGESYIRRRPFGEEGWRTGKPRLEMPAYSDRFPSQEAYDAFLRSIAENAKDLLAETGLFMLHLDWHASARGRMICDEVFGPACFVNEVIWAYESGGRAKRTFCRKHDTILLYGRTPDWRLDPMAAGIPRTSRRRSHMKRAVDERGRPYSEMVSGGRAYRYYDDDLITPGDVWTDISHLQQLDPERTGWPTQKPEALLRRLLACALKPGETMVELCCGSGTACAVADQLGCRWVGVDLSPEALATTALRLGLKGFSARMPIPATEARLQGSVDGGGLVLLAGFRTGNGDFPPAAQPLDEMEAWLCGQLEDGVFTAIETFRRSRRHPRLTPMALLPAGSGAPAVVCFDAAGHAHAFLWRED